MRTVFNAEQYLTIQQYEQYLRIQQYEQYLTIQNVWKWLHCVCMAKDSAVEPFAEDCN